MDWKGQFNRIKRDDVLSTCVVVMTTQLPNDTQARQVLFLDLDYLNGWLFGIDANRVKPELKDKIVAYQHYCYKVLAGHFNDEIKNDLNKANKRIKKSEATYFARFPNDRKIRELATTGYPYWYIADKIPCHVHTVSRAVKRMVQWGMVEMTFIVANKLSKDFCKRLKIERHQQTFNF